jgi:ribonucleoside-diphosphate reductase alpha chain
LKFITGVSPHLIDYDAFEHVVEVMITAMDILCGFAEYPTEKIKEKTLWYRNLGLGYSNLGALLMSLALPYDSSKGRRLASEITSYMTAAAYLQSTRLAEKLGVFPAFWDNQESVNAVMKMHAGNHKSVLGSNCSSIWETVVDIVETHGLRNAQTTVLAPTGTISFMMDCETTGIEPTLGLATNKTLVGGGTLKLISKSAMTALEQLDYDMERREFLAAWITEHGHIYDETWTPIVDNEHANIFSTALGTGSITPTGHIKMVAAVQPFLSGGVSKTINLPNSATVDHIADIFFEAWDRGLKNVTAYRDGCKMSQPISVSQKEEAKKIDGRIAAVRVKLPDDRPAITHKFNVAGHEGYITVGLYEDGSPGEIFVTMAKEGSTLSGVMGAFATLVSISLQFGIPLEFLIAKFKDSRYEPSGYTGNVDVPYAKSLTDYVFRWLEATFLSDDEYDKVIEEEGGYRAGLPHEPSVIDMWWEEAAEEPEIDSSAPFCPECSTQMVRTGLCHTCPSCGEVSGGC